MDSLVRLYQNMSFEDRTLIQSFLPPVPRLLYLYNLLAESDQKIFQEKIKTIDSPEEAFSEEELYQKELEFGNPEGDGDCLPTPVVTKKQLDEELKEYWLTPCSECLRGICLRGVCSRGESSDSDI